ncbi:MAG: hypothetical protein J6V82_03645 [Clostridia bacterium]|nr:hypothetical protein [Clostridia bacterium]
MRTSVNPHHPLVRHLADLQTLVMMQLKEKVDLSCFKKFKSAVTKIVFTVLQFIGVAALAFAFFYATKFLRLFSLTGAIPASVLAIVFTFMFFLSMISCMVGLTQTLYFSRDNHVLLTMPTPTALVYTSKLVVFYLYELMRNFSFLVPVLVAYGIVSSAPFGYYPWVAFVCLFITALPVLVGALLSIPAMWVYQFLRQYRLLQAIVYAVCIGALVYGTVWLINLLPTELNLVTEWVKVSSQIQSGLRYFEEKFEIFYLLAILVSGRNVNMTYRVWTPFTLPAFGVVLGAIVVLFALSFLLARPLFFKMASKPFEYKKRSITKTYKNRVYKPWFSAFKKEILLSFRKPEELYNHMVQLIGMPIMILLLNKLYNALDTRAFGNQMTFSFNILLMLLFMLSANVGIASVYSRDGRAAYMPKTQPVPYYPLLLSKLYARLIVSLLSAAAATFAMVYVRSNAGINVGLREGVLLAIGLFAFSAAHIFWSAEADIMNPQSEQYGAMGEHSKNPNETFSTVLALLISVLAAALTLLLFRENESLCWVKFCAVGVVLFAFKLFTYLKKIQVYYKEK